MASRTLSGGEITGVAFFQSLESFRTVPPNCLAIASASDLAAQKTSTRTDLPPFRTWSTKLGLPWKRSSQASSHLEAESFDQTNMRPVLRSKLQTPRFNFGPGKQ